MVRTLLVALVAAFLAVVVAAGSGVLVYTGHSGVRAHVGVAIVVLVLVLFAQTLTVVYFQSSAAWVKSVVAEAELHEHFLADGRALRTAAFRLMLTSCVVFVAAFLAGGAVDTRVVPPLVHALLALGTVGVSGFVTYRTIILVGLELDLEQAVAAASEE